MHFEKTVIAGLGSLMCAPALAAKSSTLQTPSTASIATTAPTTAPARSTEAAKLYRKAFANMVGLSEADGGRLGLCGKDGCWVVTTPLDAGTADLVVRQSDAIELARQAVGLPATDWETAGDGQRVADLSNQLPRLSALLVLNAREELKSGKNAEAVDDLVAAVALSRQAATDQTVMAKLIETSVLRPAAELLAAQLPALPKDLVAALPARFARLPASPTMTEVVHGEYAYAKKAAAKQGIAMMVMIASLGGFYDDIAKGAAGTPAEFSKVVDQQLANHPHNPWAGVIAPSFKSSRQSVAILEAKQAMLDTAIDVVLNGEAAVAKSKDPFGDGPFKYHKLAGNAFELSGKLEREGTPVTLVVGETNATVPALAK